jgi:TonB family protein
MRRLLVLSVLLHAAAVALLVWSPLPQRAVVLPGVVSVELVGPAALEGPPPAAEAPAEARPAPPPRPPVEQTVVLPKEPAPVPKPKPEAAPKPAPKPAARPEPQRSYEDVMKELRQHEGELEELTPHAPPARTAAAPAGAAAGSALASGRGVRVDPEEAAWLRRARIHVRQSWVLAPGFRTQNLEAHVVVRLDAAGHLVDEPRITRRSGNPWYDDGVLRALQKASPLPPPPEAGERLFVFRPEDWL